MQCAFGQTIWQKKIQIIYHRGLTVRDSSALTIPLGYHDYRTCCFSKNERAHSIAECDAGISDVRNSEKKNREIVQQKNVWPAVPIHCSMSIECINLKSREVVSSCRGITMILTEDFAQPPEHRNVPFKLLNCFRNTIFPFRQSISSRIRPLVF